MSPHLLEYTKVQGELRWPEHHLDQRHHQRMTLVVALRGMPSRERPFYRVIFVCVLAPVAAAVVVSVLLLFGVKPHVVFYAGFAVRSWLKSIGAPAPNAAGVLATVFVWWVVIVAIGLLWDRRRRRNS